MPEDVRPSRRQFLQTSGIALAAAQAFVACGRFQPARSLSLDEFNTLEAFAEQIIPTDQAPGGRQAGVALFLERQLRGPYARFLPMYQVGLACLERTSQQLHRSGFASLPFATQTAVLVALEQGQVPADIWKPGQAAEFFRIASDQCLQGYYGSPRHGGNRDYASWRMIHMDYPQVAGRVIG